MPKKMGYQGLLYQGTAGSTAATQITKRVDASFDIDVETGSTTSAGDGTAVPINTGEATALTGKVTFNMIHDTSDTSLVALIAAAATGAPIALRFIRSTGLLGLDADCVIKVTQGSPLKGEQTIDIEVVALSNSLREPLLNA
tara:strand:- start:680 stop:1105 length:426 start_codon:yes stop_codon:yes gene_type:complete